MKEGQNFVARWFCSWCPQIKLEWIIRCECAIYDEAINFILSCLQFEEPIVENSYAKHQNWAQLLAKAHKWLHGEVKDNWEWLCKKLKLQTNKVANNQSCEWPKLLTTNWSINRVRTIYTRWTTEINQLINQLNK